MQCLEKVYVKDTLLNSLILPHFNTLINVKNVSFNHDTKYINWNNHDIKTNYCKYVTKLLHGFSLPGLRVLVDTRLSPTITLWCLDVRSMCLHWASS